MRSRWGKRVDTPEKAHAAPRGALCMGTPENGKEAWGTASICSVGACVEPTPTPASWAGCGPNANPCPGCPRVAGFRSPAAVARATTSTALTWSSRTQAEGPRPPALAPPAPPEDSARFCGREEVDRLGTDSRSISWLCLIGSDPFLRIRKRFQPRRDGSLSMGTSFKGTRAYNTNAVGTGPPQFAPGSSAPTSVERCSLTRGTGAPDPGPTLAPGRPSGWVRWRAPRGEVHPYPFTLSHEAYKVDGLQRQPGPTP